MQSTFKKALLSLALTLLLSFGLLGTGSFSGVAWSKSQSAADRQADRNTARINAIINQLAPDRYKHSLHMSIYFAHNKTHITYRARHVLDDLGYALVSPEMKHSVYLIAGHTNAKGKRHYNQWLSEARAKAAKRYLVRRFHINPNRLVTTGFGEDRLLNKRKPYSSVNRRVEISLVKSHYGDSSNNAYQLPQHKDYSGNKAYQPGHDSHSNDDAYSPGHSAAPVDDYNKIIGQ